MIISEKGAALIVTGRGDRVVDRCASAIADISLRECRFLDALWARNAFTTSDPSRKRCHRQFLSELLAFYFCETERFLCREVPGVNERLLGPAADAVARRATRDPVLDTPPLFVSDLEAKRYYRYRKRIDEARSRLTTDCDDSGSTQGAARAIAGILRPDGISSADGTALTFQIERRLRWTAAELLGAPALCQPPELKE